MGDGSILVCFFNVLTFVVIPLLLSQFDFHLDNLSKKELFFKITRVQYFPVMWPYANILDRAYVFTSIC